MKCTGMLFGPNEKYSLQYLQDHPGFTIHKRKLRHDFVAKIMNDDLEGSKGLSLDRLGIFVITKVDQLIFFHARTYKQLFTETVPLDRTTTREPNEIIAI